MRYIVAFLIMSVLISAREYKIYNSKTSKEISIKELAKETFNNDVIFFGEFHDDSIIHSLQKIYLEEVFNLKKSTVVSLEMFERDVQSVLDSFITNKIDEEYFLKNSRPWPDYKKFYKPLVDLAKNNNSDVIAANIPRKYAALFAFDGWTGIQKLKPEERIMVASEIKIEEDEYLRKFYKTMLENNGLDSNATITPNQENTLYLYYGAQVIKDETMAESILNYIIKNPGKTIIHFNGDFHSNNYKGTVQKLIDRNNKLKIAVISPFYIEKGKNIEFKNEAKHFGDYIIVLEDKEREKISMEMMGGHLGENYAISHNIEIEINPENSSLKGKDKIKFKNPIAKKAGLKMLSSLKINEIKSSQGQIDFAINKDNLNNEVVISTKSKEITEIEISYEGKVYNSPNVTSLNQRHSNTPGIISNKEGEGIYLPGGSFYPQTDKDLAEFNVKVIMPKDLTLITSGVLINKKEFDNNYQWEYKTELATDDLTLVAGRYVTKDTVYDNIKFSLFTFKQNPKFDAYLQSSIDYYKYYTKLFGAYPYSNFKIVENFFATGFGMPSYTLLSNKLIAMPWVLLSPGSLAHEFVHNWWGNSVYNDVSLGNWCEALTTFSSNYYLNVLTNKKSAQIDWRKKALISLEALPEETNYPLSKFKYQKTTEDATIGYNKGGFLFYELLKMFGDDKFFNVLKKFAQQYKGKRATWMSLRMLFAEQSKKDSLEINTKRIFEQYLNDTKLPKVKLENVVVNNDSIKLEINQDLKFYFKVPLRITTKNNDTLWREFILKDNKNQFVIPKINNIIKITLDPDYQTLRKLNKWEIPYSFNQIINSKPLMIIPSKKSKNYDIFEKFINLVKESAYNVDYKSIDDIKDNDWKNRNIIVIGNKENNSFINKLKLPKKINITNNELIIEDKKHQVNENILMINYAHPSSKDYLATLINCGEIKDAEQLKRLFHYTSYSMVLINQNQPGMPLAQMELFPEPERINDLEVIF